MKRVYFLSILMIWNMALWAQDCPDCLHKTDISGQWFINYDYTESEKIGRFNLKRGYFTFQTEMTDLLSVRYTQDITLDTEGDDAGNIETRMKYLYLKYKMKDLGILRKTFLEFGMVHRPWLSFEEGINAYRLQSTMYAETVGLISSADLGIYFGANLGEEMDADVAKVLQEKSSGKYGSFALGIYNGGGYNAYEINGDKTIEARLSLRPFYAKLPGLQFSYSGAYGQMNVSEIEAPFVFHLFMMSFKSAYMASSVQYYAGRGSNNESYADMANRSSYRNEGSSYFLELKHPEIPFSLMSRYDYLNSYSTPRINFQNYFGGLAYHFQKNKVFLGVHKHLRTGQNADISAELAMEIRF